MISNGVSLVDEHRNIPARQLGFFETFCIQTSLLMNEFLRNQWQNIENIISSQQNEQTQMIQDRIA